ncbi:MAG: putative ABC transport system permease protein [Planctomycetota bacterium]|jgi:putative ABC transport system permease protein
MAHLPFDYAVRNLGRRPLRAILTAASSGLVVALLVATSAFVRGLESTFSGAARDDVAILLSRASEGDIVRSAISPAVSAHLHAVPGIVAVSGEVHMGTTLIAEGNPYAAFLRGVSDSAWSVHDSLTLTDGTLPSPGELLVGRLAASQMKADPKLLAIGATVEIEGAPMRISGHFEAPGTTLEAEIWTPIGPLRGLAQRDDDSVVFAKLESDDLSALQLFVARRQDLALSVMSATEYYRALTEYFAPIQSMAWALALMIAAASLFSGANTQNAAVQDRMRELATLRAMGYSSYALVRALTQESVLLAAAGGLLGVVLARLTLSGASFSIAMSAFALRVDAVAILVGIAAVLLLGLFGVLPAAWRVLRMPVAMALKET